MATFGSRLSDRMEELGLKQDELAKLSGVSQATISQIVSGRNKNSRYAVQLAVALKVAPRWLTSGKGPKDIHANVADGPELRSTVPLISWTTAGTWGAVTDPLQPGEGEPIDTTAKVGPHAFALRIVGDSMEPKIPDGSIVIIDPGRQYKHGSIVLAKRTGDQSATLKVLWYDGATPFLKPLNDRYPVLDMPADTRIIGVAVRIELDL